jgi:hypothetical protein
LNSTQSAATKFSYGGAELFVVPISQVDAAWPEIARHIQRVTDVPWTLDDVKHDLEEGFAQAWGMRRGEDVLGFWITRINNTHTRKFGVVWITAGEGLEAGVPAYRDAIEPWFWERGCEWIEIHGRKGWKRVLPDYGEVAVVLRKYGNSQRT